MNTTATGSPSTPPRGWPRLRTGGGALVLAALLYATPCRRASGQSHLDLKMMHYQEADDRIRVTSPAFLYQWEASPTLTIRIDGVYDTISGATPTGAPAASAGPAAAAAARFDDSLFATRGVYALAGATPVATPAQPASKPSSASASSSASTSAPADTGVPMGRIDDIRKALNAEVAGKTGSHLLSGKLAFSTEDDYDSLGAAVKDSVDFDQGGATAAAGLAWTHDTLDLFATDGTDTRDTIDALAGVSRVAGPRTRLTLNYVLSLQSGHLSDPYKVAEVDGVLVSENRPDQRTRHTAYLAAVHGFRPLAAAVEADVRGSTDDFGIRTVAGSVAWHQHAGERVVVSPSVRYYNQSEADFYQVRFTGAPEHYSSDYRLSALSTWTVGVKVAWFVTERLSVDAAYDRYDQNGQDGETPEELYVTADAVTLGARWLF